MRKIALAVVAAAAVCLAAAVAGVSRAEAPPGRASVGGISGAQQPIRTCDSLVLVTFADGSTVTSATDHDASGSTPQYCEVRVLIPERINVIVLLPDTNWNGRYQAVGNGVYAGSAMAPTGGLADGYVTSATDTGHQDSPFSGAWAWSPAGMNYSLIHDFAYRANHEMAVKSKALIEAYYGTPPRYSYWNGCSTGGREGITEAFRYPTDFDGILAKSPAINWSRFIPAEVWPAVAMKELGDYLPSCKASALPALVQQACDATDGVEDGLWDSRDCKFDARSLIGVQTACGAFTATDAAVIQKIWNGPRRVNGGFLWYGLTPGSDFGSAPGLGLATTVSQNGQGVDAVPFLISNDWFKYFLHKDPSWDWHSLTFAQYEHDFDQSVTEWDDDLGTNNPNLRAFREHGGKLIMWHGLQDQLIFPQGSIDYYDRVVRKNGGLAATQKFMRFYLSPNVTHCSGGIGPNPPDLFALVVKWRETRDAPGTLTATLPPGTGVNDSNQPMTRPVCLYPKRVRYKGSGSIYDASSFRCVKGKTGTGNV
jgi:hypothetical protein